MKKKSRPIAILDCDGVLLDLHGALASQLGVPENIMSVQWDLFPLLTPEQERCRKNLMSHISFWRNLPAIEHSKAGVKFIQDSGVTVVVASAPYGEVSGWEKVRRDLLREEFGIRHFIPAPSVLKPLIQGNSFVDDKKETVKAWAKANRRYRQAFLMKAPFNKGPSGFKCLDWDNFDSVKAFVKRTIDDHRFRPVDVPALR